MEEPGMQRDFYRLVWTSLLATCPRDTGNMVSNISLEEYEDYYLITIAAPTGTGYDYARDVNYNRQRTAKEARNYQWVERVLKQTAILLGGNIQYELH